MGYSAMPLCSSLISVTTPAVTKGLSWQRSTQRPLLTAFISSIFEVIYLFICQCFNQHFLMYLPLHDQEYFLLQGRKANQTHDDMYLIGDIKPRFNFLIVKCLFCVTFLMKRLRRDHKKKKSN